MGLNLVNSKLLALFLGSLLLVSFQNCAPPGDSFEDNSQAQSSETPEDPVDPPPLEPEDPTIVETVCPSNATPVIAYTNLGTVTVFSGYGASDSGDRSPASINIPFSDSNAGQSHECLVSDTDGNGGRIETPTCTVNTGSIRVGVSPDQNCRQGTITASFRIRDICTLNSNELTSETATLTVVVINACLAEAATSAAPLVHGANYGSDTDMDGSWVAIASARDSSDDGFLSLHGSIHLYQRSGTTLTFRSRVVPSDIAAGDANETRRNGATVSSVGLSGDYLVVGAPRSGLNDGAAYIFQRQTDNTWVQIQRILPPDGLVDSYFGQSVAISGDRIVIGAPEASSGGIGRGAAYVYDRSGTTWAQMSTLTAGGNAINYEQFGYDVAIDANNIVVGAPLNPLNRTNAPGAAYYFPSANYTSGTKIAVSGLNVGSQLGFSVGISGTRIVVGAPGWKTNPLDSAQNDAGKAYLFNSASLGAIPVELRSESGKFGFSVGIDGQKILVGAPFHSSERGATFLYDLSKGGNYANGTNYFQLSGTQTSDQFGYAVTVLGNYGVVGAPLVNISTTVDPGRAKLYELISTNF